MRCSINCANTSQDRTASLTDVVDKFAGTVDAAAAGYETSKLEFTNAIIAGHTVDGTKAVEVGLSTMLRAID